MAATLLVLVGCTPTAPADEHSSLSPQSSPTTPSPTPSEEKALQLVAIGDSIPYNSPEDCPNCTGLVDRYATALASATGRTVDTANLSEHNGLTVPDLVKELQYVEKQLASADAIIIGVAHNSNVLAGDKICGATWDGTTNRMSDWSKVDAKCAKRSAARYRAQYDQLFARVAELRQGQPTIMITINRYNDWIGWPGVKLTPDQLHRTTVVVEAWNKMICATAKAHDIACADIYHAINGPKGTRAAGDLLVADYIHPSDKGNAVIAKVLIDRGFQPLS